MTFAFLLGQSTATKFFKVMVGLPSKDAAKFRDHLKRCFKVILKLNDLFADWLASNLHHLNDTSAGLLETLDNTSLDALRCSTVC